MTRIADRADEVRTRKRTARRYRTLGYDVVEQPGPHHLPDFIRDTSPDLVARSASDNVVVEIKRHAALKGSNDLVGLAERVSDRPGWRVELVVLADDEPAAPTDHGPLIAKARFAADAGLTEVATLSLLPVLAAITTEIARNYGVRLADGPPRRLVEALGFRGVLPEPLVDRCLVALARAETLVGGEPSGGPPSRAEVEELAQVCEALRQLP